MKKVLIGCEESGTLSGAFRDAGHAAWSCDLEPSRGDPDWHFQEDVFGVLTNTASMGWDLIILHPPCDALAVSGNRWYGSGMPHETKRHMAILWTKHLWNLAKATGARVALENPVSVIFQYLDAPVCYIQPYEHGHMEQKKTGFALHRLPKLEPTDNVYDEMMQLPKAERERVWHMSPGPNRKRDRSKTYDGIAKAIVQQWGPYL